MKVRIKIVILLMLYCAISNAQHEAGYSQYMFNGLMINPAFAGSTGAMNVTVAYKNQWTGFEDAPKTSAFSVHSPLKKESSSFGLQFVNDHFGLTTKSRMNAAYTYRIKVAGDVFLRMGLQAGMESMRNDYSKLVTIQSGDASFNDAGRYNYFVSGAGLYLHSDKFFTGLSMPVIYETFRQSATTYRTVFFYSGIKLKLNSVLSFQPSFLMKYIKRSPAQADINGMLIYNEKFGGGLSYRSNESIVINLFYDVNKQLFIGYAFEANTGKISKLAKNSHEITLKYLFNFYRKVQNPKTFF